MPLYEYQCEKCGNVFEILQKFSDPPLIVHDGCGGKVQKRLSAPGLQFKGSGWYITDYARASSKPEATTEGKTPAESKAESKPASETKSEAKPATPAKTD
jgi:putative FmdB family regulatory protein